MHAIVLAVAVVVIIRIVRLAVAGTVDAVVSCLRPAVGGVN